MTIHNPELRPALPVDKCLGSVPAFTGPLYEDPKWLDDVSVSEETIEHDTAVNESNSGQVRKVANFISGLPQQLNQATLRAAVEWQTNPMNFLKRTGQGAVVAGEISPLNETMRYGALAYALENTSGGPVVGALVLGATTLVVEGAAALSTASLLSTDASSKTITKLNNAIHKRIGKDIKMDPLVEAGVAMVGGSAIVLAEKHREDPLRTLSQNRRHGLFTTGWMATYFTAEGAFIGVNSSNGDAINARTIGATLLAFAASAAGAKFALRKTKSSKQSAENVTV